jgi:diguanylate cyclase (GGDEF)-like protein
MQSRTDTATGALNRFGMTEVVEGAWVEFKSAGAHFGLILIDLDYFRRLDATFGHDDAEAVLSRVVQTVQPQLRASDALGRWGRRISGAAEDKGSRKYRNRRRPDTYGAGRCA